MDTFLMRKVCYEAVVFRLSLSGAQKVLGDCERSRKTGVMR